MHLAVKESAGKQPVVRYKSKAMFNFISPVSLASPNHPGIQLK